MGHRWKHWATLGQGEKAVQVGYSPTKRDGLFGVRFLDPQGKRLEKMTRCEVSRGGKVDGRYHLEVAKILNDAYRTEFPDPKKVTFDVALAEVLRTAKDLRPKTLAGFVKAIAALQQTLDADKLTPKITSPIEITEDIANRFSVLWLSGTYKRSRKSDAKEHTRKPITLAHYLRMLRAIWKRFRKLGYTKSNPWKEVELPEYKDNPKPVPTEEETDHFWQAIFTRYPTWERLHALLDLKAVSGCRTLDLCQLRSDQLKEFKVNWTAEQRKNGRPHSALMADELFTRLERLAGPTFLWEHFLDDIRQHRPGRNAIPKKFQASTVYNVVANIFREYSDANPKRPRMTPHALRRRAITLTVIAMEGNLDKAAQAIDVNPQTARKYYVDSERAFSRDDTQRQTANLLLPKRPSVGVGESSVGSETVKRN